MPIALFSTVLYFFYADAHLMLADFERADVSHANFKGAFLTDSNFVCATVNHSDFSGDLRQDTSTRMPHACLWFESNREEDATRFCWPRATNREGDDVSPLCYSRAIVRTIV